MRSFPRKIVKRKIDSSANSAWRLSNLLWNKKRNITICFATINVWMASNGNRLVVPSFWIDLYLDISMIPLVMKPPIMYKHPHIWGNELRWFASFSISLRYWIWRYYMKNFADIYILIPDSLLGTINHVNILLNFFS